MEVVAGNASRLNDGDDDDNVTDVATVRHVLGQIQLYYTPVLVGLGTAGNCISVVVFFTSSLCKLSSSFYLAALAISDTVFLFNILVSWLDLFDVSWFNMSVVCEMSVLTVSVSSFLSSWLVVAFTVERFIAVIYPLRRPSMCTVRRAKGVIAGLTGFSLLLYGPYVFLSGAEQRPEHNNMTLCGPYAEYMDVVNTLNYVDTVITFVLPFAIIATLNACISRTVWRLARIRRTMTLTVKGVRKLQHARGGKTVAGSVRKPRPAGGYRPQSSQTKVTKMLLVVSTVFLALNLPSYVMRAVIFFKDHSQHDMVVAQHISMLLFYTNFGINFVLYCVSGQNFRRALTTMCCPDLARRRHDTTHVTVVSEYLRSTSSVARRRPTTTTFNGNGCHSVTTWQDAHEMLPLAK